MPYQATITQKGQITIPKFLRDALKLRASSKIVLKLEKSGKEIKIKPAMDILDIAGSLKPKARKAVLRARQVMEKNYARI